MNVLGEYSLFDSVCFCFYGTGFNEYTKNECLIICTQESGVETLFSILEYELNSNNTNFVVKA